MCDGGAASLVAVLIAMSTAAVANADWCVAQRSARPEALQKALDYACSHGSDCSPIQPNGSCFLPNTLQGHASYAFNGYYRRNRRSVGSCFFGGTATISREDPSYDGCTYPSSRGCSLSLSQAYLLVSIAATAVTLLERLSDL